MWITSNFPLADYAINIAWENKYGLIDYLWDAQTRSIVGAMSYFNLIPSRNYHFINLFV